MFVFSNSTYDFVKKLVQVILPAISAAYFGLASIWDLPEPDKVVGTIAVFTTFLGVCLGISHGQYKDSDAAFDGKIVTTNVGDKITYSLELDNLDPIDIANKEAIRFRVVPAGPAAESELRHETFEDDVN